METINRRTGEQGFVCQKLRISRIIRIMECRSPLVATLHLCALGCTKKSPPVRAGLFVWLCMGDYCAFSIVQMLTRFQDSSSNMWPMPSPSATMRSAAIL